MKLIAILFLNLAAGQASTMTELLALQDGGLRKISPGKPYKLIILLALSIKAISLEGSLKATEEDECAYLAGNWAVTGLWVMNKVRT